jgi:hypothetical protein
MSSGGTANDCAGCRADAGPLTDWRLTRTQNKRAYREDRNRCEKIPRHKFTFVDQFNRANKGTLHGKFKKP